MFDLFTIKQIYHSMLQCRHINVVALHSFGLTGCDIETYVVNLLGRKSIKLYILKPCYRSHKRTKKFNYNIIESGKRNQRHLEYIA